MQLVHSDMGIWDLEFNVDSERQNDRKISRTSVLLGDLPFTLREELIANNCIEPGISIV